MSLHDGIAMPMFSPAVLGVIVTDIQQEQDESELQLLSPLATE